MSSTFLNQLPREIFFIIFKYLWAHEILSSFGNISDYMTCILSSYNNYLINLESIRKSHVDLICRSIRPEQIISLILSDKNDTPNQSQLFRSVYSIEKFVNLRALKFIKLDDDGKSFFGNLSKLKHLVSFEIDVKIDLPLIKIPSTVERLVINIPSNMHFDISRSIQLIQFEQLRYLSLCNCSCKQLQQILCRAIQLTSLKVSLAFLNPEELLTFIKFHRRQTIKSPLLFHYHYLLMELVSIYSV